MFGAEYQCVGEYTNKIFDRVEGMIQSLQRELFALVERRFAETQARISLIAEGRSEPKGEFRFANEKSGDDSDEPVDLPNPLPPPRDQLTLLDRRGCAMQAFAKAARARVPSLRSLMFLDVMLSYRALVMSKTMSLTSWY
jgi:hypothetical protein